MDSINSYPKHTPTFNKASPLDPAWNVAVRHMANRTCPSGWDEVPTFAEAPTTLYDLTLYAQTNGRLCVATEDSDGTIFDCADTNVHLRAWHDSIHFRHQIAFTVAGEAAATYAQVGQLYTVYGYNDKTVRWASLLLSDILGLVIHRKQAGKYPKNKRAGTINGAKRWLHIAHQIGVLTGDTADGRSREQIALSMAKADWGNYSE